MGLFTTALLVSAIMEARGNRGLGQVQAAERAKVYERRDRRETIAASRTKWLGDHASQRSFPCGVVRPAEEGADDEALQVLRGMDLEMPVTAAVLDDAVAFLAEPSIGTGVDQVIEAGRIPRSALTETDVVDVAGVHVPEPMREGFDPEVDVWLVLRWGSGESADEEWFLFRSTWLAWEAARRLRAAAEPLAP